jgi:hypothetical protein
MSFQGPLLSEKLESQFLVTSLLVRKNYEHQQTEK